jgi:CDGSH-type Zn-finger protein
MAPGCKCECGNSGGGPVTFCVGSHAGIRADATLREFVVEGLN